MVPSVSLLQIWVLASSPSSQTQVMMHRVILTSTAIASLFHAIAAAVNPVVWEWLSGGTDKPTISSASLTLGSPVPVSSLDLSSVGNFAADEDGNTYVYGGVGSALFRMDPLMSTFTWITGDKTTASAVYGVLGKESASVRPGAITYSGMTYFDNAVYIYGGYTSYSNQYCSNTMWRFNVTSSMFAWVAGKNYSNASIIPADYISLNPSPGSRGGFGFVSDFIENIFLFGGRYSWNIWGGFGDLWSFNVKKLSWSWIGGSSAQYFSGNYTAPNQMPPARFAFHMCSAPRSGMAYFFGGDDARTQYHTFGDFWSLRFNDSLFSWIGGISTSVGSDTAQKGTQFVPSSSSRPPAGGAVSCWVDNEGVYIFGGHDGSKSTGNLFKFVFSQNQFAWISGEGNPAVYGQFDSRSLPKPATADQRPWITHYGNVFCYFSSSGQLWCFTPCSYFNGSGSCDICPSGFGMTSNQANCTACSPGFYSFAGQCSACVQGKVSSQSQASDCFTCSQGFFTSPNADSCLSCSPGTYSSLGSTFCKLCGAGRFAQNSSSAACDLCPAGTFSVAEGASTCPPCSAGNFSTGGSSPCVECFLGKFSQTGASLCEDCLPGRYSSEPPGSSCLVCPKGSQSPPSSARINQCQCSEGTYGRAFANETCHTCVNHAAMTCPSNSSSPYVNDGYFWNPQDPDHVFQCIPSTACQASNSSTGTTCHHLYTGYLCGSCIRLVSYRQGTGCQLCPGQIAKGFTIVILLTSFALICWKLGNNLGAIPTEIKTLFSALQMIALFPGLYTDWPPNFSNFLNILTFTVYINLFCMFF
jgi:hypothetical protein